MQNDLDLKVGMSVQFMGMTTGINGYICMIEPEEDGGVHYLRDSLTRWVVTKQMVMRGREIPVSEYIEMVKKNAGKSGHRIPTTEEIKQVLKLFTDGFESVDISKVHKILKP